MKDLVARILSPHISVRVGGKTYKIKQNVDWELRLEAQNLQDSLIHRHRFEKFIRRNQVEPILQQMGFAIDRIEPLNEQIKTLKKDLYRKYPDKFSQRGIRSQLNAVRSELIGIYTEIASLDTHTLESYAEKMSLFYILRNSCNDLKNASFNLIERVYYEWARLNLGADAIRAMARDDYWRNLWISKKISLFRYMPLTEEQLTLASFSRMYDSVYKHHESPPQEVILDDDMLDGWLLLQQDPKKKQPSYGSKIDSSKEVFIMAQDEEHAKSIYEMNTPEQQAVQKSRLKQLGAKGQLQFGQFADVQRGVQNAAR